MYMGWEDTVFQHFSVCLKFYSAGPLTARAHTKYIAMHLRRVTHASKTASGGRKSSENESAACTVSTDFIYFMSLFHSHTVTYSAIVL